MAKCWICGKTISDNAGYSQSIEVGTIKKKYVGICDECSSDLGVIERLGSTSQEIENVVNKFEKNTQGNPRAKKYIENKRKNYERKMKTYKKVYYVSFVDAVVPDVCVNCLGKTKRKKSVVFNMSEALSRRRVKVTTKRIKFPLCTNCRKAKSDFNVRFEDMNTLVFTNKRYAELFAHANNSVVRETEENGNLKYDVWNFASIINRYGVLFLIWVSRILIAGIIGYLVYNFFLK